MAHYGAGGAAAGCAAAGGAAAGGAAAMVPVLRVLVYLPVLETRMSKAVSSGETSVSRPKNVTWELY